MSLDSDSLQSADSQGDVATSNGTHTWGGNGSGAVVAEAEAPAAQSDEPPAATADESTGSAVDDASGATTTSDPADDRSAFLTELTRAMQATAGAERERAVAGIERRREQYLAGIEARRVAVAAEIRTLADKDLAAIDAWAEGERTRIANERETRAAALRDDSERSLAEHGARIDREIAGVEAAVAAHRTDVDAFFSAFDHETDPVVIAQNAGRRPTFPALDSIAGESDTTTPPSAPASDGEGDPTASGGVGEPADATDPSAEAPRIVGAEAAPNETSEGVGVGVGVMSPAPRAGLADAWAAWSDPREQTVSSAAESTDAEAATSSSNSEPTSGPESLGVFAVTSSVHGPSPTPGLIQSMPINRPLGWLRRGSGIDDPNKGP